MTRYLAGEVGNNPKVDHIKLTTRSLRYPILAWQLILLLHVSRCERSAEFAPTLAKLSLRVPSLAYGRLNISSHPKTNVPGVAAAAIVSVQPGAPQLRAFIRRGARPAQDEHEVLEYAGAPTLDAVLGWLEEVDAWQDAPPEDNA